MSKSFFSKLLGTKNLNSKPVLVTFTGGLGAQILSASAYFYLKKSSVRVCADLSYFDLPYKVAVPGLPGDCSHWSWELSHFGLEPNIFAAIEPTEKLNDFNILADGPEKLRTALNALNEPFIQAMFRYHIPIEDLLSIRKYDEYLCMHIRRGDYLNVASLVLADEVFLTLARKFTGLLSRLVVLSDSPISEHLKQELALLYPHHFFLDSLDAFSAHSLMRKARVLVCSNSQFSLTAAMLNPSALKLVPRAWFGKSQQSHEAPIHEACKFEILG